MLKNAYFWRKTYKIAASSEVPPSDPHVLTLAYHYNFVEYISSAKCVLLPSKKEQNNNSK